MIKLMAPTVTKAMLIVALLTVSGCAFMEDSITPKYNPPANLSIIQNAPTLAVAVEGQDGRVSNRDRVGSKKNGYGIETARIVSTVDGAGLFRDAVEHELTSFGFPSGSGGLRVMVEVQTFYNDFKNGFFSGDAVAEAAFNLTISGADGALIYAHAYRGIGMNKNIMMATGSMAQPALQEALANAMQSMVSDASLRSALQHISQNGRGTRVISDNRAP